MFKSGLVLAATAVAALGAPAFGDRIDAQLYSNPPVSATAPASAEIVVQSPTRASWVATMARELSDAMRYPHTFSNELTPHGIAGVQFECSTAGTPDKIALTRPSGDPRLDRAALATVRRLKTMHPLPAGLKHDQRFMAMLVFARSKPDLKEQLKKLETETATATAARAGGSDGVIALVAAVPVGRR